MSDASDAEIVFVKFEDICEIHDLALEQFGEGAPGFVDEHAVRSAAAQAEASVFGQYLHEFPAGMAAAYLFFLTRQQGFVQGNKRTAVGTALTFLAQNGFDLDASPLEVFDVTRRLASEDDPRPYKLLLGELTDWFEAHIVPLSD